MSTDEDYSYTCRGHCRGTCGSQHETAELAAACCHVDMAAVKEGHGRDAYSDRRPVRVVNGEEFPLLKWEHEDIERWEIEQGR